jgi:fructose-1,6-bisphosphatase/sedoheptulose 1,7-bisphosphatase-like protein
VRTFKNKPVVKKFLGVELETTVTVGDDEFTPGCFLFIGEKGEQTYHTKEEVAADYIETTRKPKGE